MGLYLSIQVEEVENGYTAKGPNVSSLYNDHVYIARDKAELAKILSNLYAKHGIVMRGEPECAN